MAGTILVTGGSGYVGGRLVPLLLSRGYAVRVLARSKAKLQDRPWANHPQLEIVEGDVMQRAVLDIALQGCSVVYYLVHSMSAPGDFSHVDRQAAYTMAEALQGSSVERVVYLSGIVPNEVHISSHLRSREEVGRILRLGHASVTILQAAQIIGVGSASFEMLRYLADRLPFMVGPAWLDTKTQPISMSNVLEYLVGVLEHPQTAGQTYDIGGPDVVSYRELMNVYTDVAGLPRRSIVTIPLLPLGMVAVTAGLVTPVPFSLAKALVEGMRNEVTCSECAIRSIIPQELLTVKQAVSRALGRVRRNDVDTSWSDAGLPSIPEWVAHGDPAYAGGQFHTDGFKICLHAEPQDIWPSIEAIGGSTGWYSRNILWKLRGFMDRLAGGPGVQRGRRKQGELRTGDSLDFWRVFQVRPGERLLLLTEMRLPGEGLMDMSLTCPAPHQTELIVSLYYRPRGLMGKAYWYAVMPFHSLAFKGMLKAIAKETGKTWQSGPQRCAALPLHR